MLARAAGQVARQLPRSIPGRAGRPAKVGGARREGKALKAHSTNRANRPEEIRVVIDTCALVAARFSPEGAASRLLDLCIDGRVEAVISDAIERETLEIVSRVRPPAKFQQRLKQFHLSASRVAPEIRLDVVEDPADNKYLECARAGQADCIVTSDRHLLVHDGFHGIRICKAGSLLKTLDREPVVPDSEEMAEE